MVERKHLLLFSLQFTAEFCCLEDLLAQFFVVVQRVIAHLGVGSKVAETLLLLLPRGGHSTLQGMELVHDFVLLLLELAVTLFALAARLLDLQLEELGCLVQPVDLPVVFANGLLVTLVLSDTLLVSRSVRLR